MYAGPSELLDEGLFEIAVQTTNTLTHAKAEELIRSVVEEVIANGVSKSELKAVASTARFASAQRRDSVMSLMDGLSEEVARGSWKRFYTLIPDILKVTSSDVQRVAKKYFNDSQKTTGYFIHTT